MNIVMTNAMAVAQCRGFVMTEWLVGCALALGVLSATHMSYQALQQSNLLLQALEVLQHNADTAFDHVQTSVQSTGAWVMVANAEAQVTLQPVPAAHWQMQEGGAHSDGLTVSHETTHDEQDCQGNRAADTQWIRDSYQVNDKQELTCKDSLRPRSTYQAIAEGVEDFQLMYAVRTRSSAGPPLWQWVTGNQVKNVSEVVAIDVCLRMVSTHPARTAPLNSTGCRGEPLANDGKLRRVLHRVVAIRPHATSR